MGMDVLPGPRRVSRRGCQIEPGGLALCALSMLAYCMVPLALGFLLGQVGANGIVCNATGNIVGMVISFFGGAWISLDLMTPEIVTLAHLLPGYWYSSACSAARHAPAIMDSATLELVLGHVGVLLLFARRCYASPSSPDASACRRRRLAEIAPPKPRRSCDQRNARIYFVIATICKALPNGIPPPDFTACLARTGSVTMLPAIISAPAPSRGCPITTDGPTMVT